MRACGRGARPSISFERSESNLVANHSIKPIGASRVRGPFRLRRNGMGDRARRDRAWPLGRSNRQQPPLPPPTASSSQAPSRGGTEAPPLPAARKRSAAPLVTQLLPELPEVPEGRLQGESDGKDFRGIELSGREALHLRPFGPEPNALPGCATPRCGGTFCQDRGRKSTPLWCEFSRVAMRWRAGP